MKNILKQNIYFLTAFALWLIIGAVVLMFISKGDLVLFFNENRTVFANVYFSIASSFAEFGFVAFFIFILLNKSYGNAFITTSVFVISGIVVQILKRVFAMPRPAAFFDESTLNFIGNGKWNYGNSFPSGHTTTIFALFFVFGFFVKDKRWQTLFFLIALSTAFARIYLLQHFFIDVYFGSILGTFIAALVFVSINSSNIFGFQSWKNKKLGLKRLF